MIPTSDEQIKFLIKLQRLLDETRTTSTYKFALLLALADLSVERGDEFGSPLPLSTDEIAAKFVAYYWQHAFPYRTHAGGVVLRQNTDRAAVVITELQRARDVLGYDCVADALNDRRVLGKIESTVRGMPLTRLQNVGRGKLDFLYEDRGKVRNIVLRPGIAYCFRRFHGIVRDLVRGAWLRLVRQLNAAELGTDTDIQEFLFGSERMTLTAAREVLEDLEHRCCFYCGREIKAGQVQVDHFVPWSRYPVNLGHNLVLADKACNYSKSDRLPSCRHLAAWADRNRGLGPQLAKAFEKADIYHDLSATVHIVFWAYSDTESAEGLTWERGDQMVPLKAAWRSVLARGIVDAEVSC